MDLASRSEKCSQFGSALSQKLCYIFRQFCSRIPGCLKASFCPSDDDSYGCKRTFSPVEVGQLSDLTSVNTLLMSLWAKSHILAQTE